jgi:predicted porin
VPRAGDADVASYYVEGRYKITPQLFAGLRWNQQLFGDVDDATGRERAWDRDTWRVDVVTGYRFDRHLQTKMQYAHSHQIGARQQGEQLVALQLTLKF